MRGFADLGEIGVFGEEAVAGMDGVHVGDFGGADHVRNVQIAFRAARRADAHGLVGKAHVQGVAIGFGVDGHGANAQFLAGADDPQGDFTAVGNQNLAEHHGWKNTPRPRYFFFLAGRRAKSDWPYSTGWPFSASTPTISPPISASISFISFMASMMQTTWPA